MSDDLERRIQERLAEIVNRDIEHLMSGGILGSVSTCTAPQAEPKTLNLRDFVAKMTNLRAQWRRTDLTITASASHIGPMVKVEHPTEGTFIEMHTQDAQRLHEEYPLVLKKVVDQETAEFAMATPLHGWIPSVLPMPPYDLPEAKDDEG